MRLSMYSFLLLAFVSLADAQEGIPFTSFQKHYIKGGTQLIGNTILGEHPTKDFNDTKVLNDEVKMVYVDVDNDDSTFSSSEATLQLPDTATKISYAGLYWSGLYPAERSKMRKGISKMIYTNQGERNAAVQNIKLKTNTSEYQAIEGTVLFDGSTSQSYQKDAPYVCYANVTHLVNLATETAITVANIRATQGFIEGGSAGGWVLYVIYEDPTQSPKYCTTFQGFQGVDKKGVNVVFDNFQTKKETSSKAFILMAALEGDTRVRSDACFIYHPEEEKFIALENATRSPKNFFNSTITSQGESILYRNPASINTLGLDIAKVALPQGIMKPETKEIKLQWSTKADRFYLFFTAFETEILQELFTAKKEVTTTLAQSTPPKTKETVSANMPSAVAEPPPTKTFVPSEEFIESKDETLETKMKRVATRPSIEAKGMKKGYYLVTNVFANETNANEWKNYLNEQGFNARMFKGVKNQWNYVYIESSTDSKKMIERKQIINQFSYLTKVWVARVNH